MTQWQNIVYVLYYLKLFMDANVFNMWLKSLFFTQKFLPWKQRNKYIDILYCNYCRFSEQAVVHRIYRKHFFFTYGFKHVPRRFS